MSNFSVSFSTIPLIGQCSGLHRTGAMARTEKLTRLGLCAMAFILPWDELVMIPGIGSCTRAVGILVMGMGMKYLLEGSKGIVLTPANRMLMVFLGWLALTSYWSPSPQFAATLLATYAQDLLMVLLIAQFAGEHGFRMDMLRMYMLGSAVTAAAVLRDFLTGTDYSAETGETLRYSAKPSGDDGGAGFDPNDVALLLALALPFAVHKLMHSPGRRLAWSAMIAVLLFAIGLTGSRGGSIAAAAGLLGTLLLEVPRMRSRRQQLFAGTLLICLITAATVFLPEAWWARMSSIQSEVLIGQMASRKLIWSAGWDLFKEHKMAGIGLGGFPDSVAPVLGIPRMAHNVFLSIAAETGVIGLVLFLCYLALVLRKVIRNTAADHAILLCMVTAWLVGAMDLSWEYRKSTWFVLGIASSVLAPLHRRSAKTSVPVAVTPR